MSFPRQAIVVQARLQSSRLPGKVMREIAGRPLLEHLIDRINLDTIDWPLIISTSSLKYDDPICDFCSVKGIECFRGSHLNVASRYHEVCKKYNLDAFLRISADSPMMDGSLVSQFIGYWRPNLDLLSNIHPRTYPKGQSLEIINSRFYSEHFHDFDSDFDREHVTPYFYRNLKSVRFENITFEENLSQYSLAIDTPEELERFDRFVNSEGDTWIKYNFREILNRYSAQVEG